MMLLYKFNRYYSFKRERREGKEKRIREISWNLHHCNKKNADLEIKNDEWILACETLLR